MISRNKVKSYVIYILLGIIAGITAVFLIIDWSMGETDFSAAIKYLVSCSCVSMAWMIGKDGLDARDTLLLRISFGFILIGDFFLVILNRFANPNKHAYFFIAGVCCFAGLHIFLIIRHSRNLREFLIKSKGRQILFLAGMAMVIIVIALIKLFILYPFLKNTLVLIAVIIYGIILSVSLYCGWTTLHYLFFPKLNAWLIAVSVTLFFLSDFCIAIAQLIKTAQPIAGPLIWTLYAPALTAIALSGFKYGIPSCR